MADKKIILAVDDNVQQLNEFKSMLSSRYDLRAAKSACAAVSYLKRNVCDVILLDIEMPDISGFEFFDEIKNTPGLAKAPVIFVSGNSDREYPEKTDKYGASDVLIKPVRSDSLIAAIEKAVS